MILVVPMNYDIRPVSRCDVSRLPLRVFHLSRSQLTRSVLESHLSSNGLVILPYDLQTSRVVSFYLRSLRFDNYRVILYSDSGSGSIVLIPPCGLEFLRPPKHEEGDLFSRRQVGVSSQSCWLGPDGYFHHVSVAIFDLGEDGSRTSLLAPFVVSDANAKDEVSKLISERGVL